MSNPAYVDLESRVIGGGSGSGGISLPDFDSFPDNAISVIDEGIIFKYSNDNLSTSISQNLGSIGLKLIGFMPSRFGFVSYPYFAMLRVHYNARIYTDFSPGSGNRVIHFDWSSWLSQFALNNAYKYPLGSFNFELGGEDTSGIPAIRVMRMGLSFGSNNWNDTNTLSLIATLQTMTSATNHVTIKPGYVFSKMFLQPQQNLTLPGYLITDKIAIGPFNAGVNIAVDNLNALPQNIASAYPQSWV